MMNEGTSVRSRIRNELLYKVYGLMTLGLGLTAGISYFFGTNPALKNYVKTHFGLFFILLLVQLGLVMALSFMIQRISSATASFIFVLYSILTGITLSSIFIVYTEASIGVTFLVTAGMFAAMALYGYFTKADLSGMQSFLFMALIGLVIAIIVNMFLRSPAMDYIISAFGVVIFSLLTAFDVQKIKVLGEQMLASHEDMLKISILGALTLYLDFLNLFLYLLTFLGQRRND